MKEFTSILEPNEEEIVIKKSRFIAKAFPVETEQEAEEILLAVRKKHYKATHNCYAYCIGQDGIIKKASDDGEPQATAGRPILSVIENNNLTNILIVVTRYFGGIKLGASGLVRAYTQSASESLKTATLLRKRLCSVISFQTDYSFFGRLKAYLSDEKREIRDVKYTSEVNAQVYIPFADTQKTIKDITELSNGTVIGEVLDTVYIDEIEERHD